MKIRQNPFLARLALAGLSLALGTTAKADIFDNNSTTSGFGVTNGSTYDWLGTNLWNTGTGATPDAGTATTATWTSGRAAYFVGAGSGTTYTVRLGGSGTGNTTIGNLALNVNSAATGALSGAAGNVTIGNTGDSGILTLVAANSIFAHGGGTLTVNNNYNLAGFTTSFRGGNVVINGVISGSGSSNVAFATGFSLSSGTLTLAGDNTFVGTTSVASGYVLVLQHANALGAAGGTNSVSTGGALEVASGIVTNSGEAVTINGSGASLGALRAGAGGGTWAGQVTLGDTSARLGAAAGNTLTVTGSIISGGGTSLAISGAAGTGVVILNPTTSNTYTGATTIVRGILRLGKNDALPTGTTLDVDVANAVTDAATFDMAGFSQSVAVLQDTATTNINGRITNSVGSTTSTLTVNQASDTSYDGIIENGSGSVILTKGGAGNLTLNGLNTYTAGTNIKNGILTLGGGNDRLAVGGSVVLGDATTTGKLALGDATTARSQTLAGLTTTGLGGGVVGANASTNSVLTLAIASGTNPFAGTLGGVGTNENRLSLTKTGAGTLLLSGSNSYLGATTVSAGILAIGSQDALGSTSGISVANVGSATLRIDVPDTTSTAVGAGRSVTINNFGDSNIGALQGGASINATWAGNVVIGTSNARIGGGAGGTLTVSGVISQTASGSNVLFSRAANSTTILSNQNTYTGETQLFMGGSTTTLKMGIANAINSASRVVLNSPTSGTGYFDLGGYNQNIRAISDTLTGDLVVTNSSLANDAELKLSTTDTQTFGGWIQDGASKKTSLVVAGSGVQILSGTNTYTGTTDVTGGNLIINGNISTSSLTSVSGTGTLSGIGTVGAATILAGGTLAPGNSIGTLNFSQTLTLAGISNFEIDPTLSSGLNADLANVTSGVTYGGTLNVTYAGASSNFANGMQFNLFDASSFSGVFGTLNFPTLTSGLTWQNDLALNGSIAVVPEPSDAALLSGLGMLALLRRRRN